MQLQPDVKKAPPKFEKVVIPLTEEDLIIRERPRRMPEPPEDGAELDRRPVRPKRPKPERRSFESFQEQLGTAEQSVEAGETVEDIPRLEESPQEKRREPAKQPPVVEDDGFGEGLT